MLSYPPGALPVPAYLGGSESMTRTPVVGQPAQGRAPVYVPGAESLSAGEIRVSVLGSGDPWIRRSQASGSLVIEVGNAEKDFFFFDLGSGSLANFTSLMLPVEATTKVFLSHLHADHIGDIPGLIGSLAKAGRVDQVEIWGGGSEDPALRLAAFVEHMGSLPLAAAGAVTAELALGGAQEDRMPELLLSNFFSPGQGALEHAMDALAVLFAGARQVLFVPYAGSDPDAIPRRCGRSSAALAYGSSVLTGHRPADGLGPG